MGAPELLENPKEGWCLGTPEGGGGLLLLLPGCWPPALHLW